MKLKRFIKNEKGVSLVLLALSVVVIFGFAAVAVDIGHLYNVKNQLQVSADAAALAGVVKLNGNGMDQPAARAEAQRIAGLNTADVAADAVPAHTWTTGAAAGEPIPVALQPNTANDAAGDIVVGNWNSSRALGDQFHPGETPVNAIKVVARRRGDIPQQPPANNWFAKVLSLIPGSDDYGVANVAGTAIAARPGIPVVPIAVNEYWHEDPMHSPGKPYGQSYPQSFMRQTNVDETGTPGFAGTDKGIFAILGVEANANQSSLNLNSFVDILLRNEYHDGRPGAWHEIRIDSTTGNCSPCGNNLIELGGGVNTGAVNNTKYQENFSYLFRGIPNNVIVPNAVREIVRGTPTYWFNNYTSSNGNDPSVCPHATIPYYSSSGSGPVGKKFDTDDPDFAFNGKRFWEVYKQDDDPQFVVMVYDGTHAGKDYPNQADTVTVVGYGVIEIDGYKSGPFNGNPTTLRERGNTAYGHAIPHGLTGVDPTVADVSDPYIIQPPLDSSPPGSIDLPSPHQGSCEFTELITNLAASFGNGRLVDASIKYGVHQQ